MLEIFNIEENEEPWLHYMAFRVFGIHYSNESLKKFLEWISMHYENFFDPSKPSSYAYFDQIIEIINTIQKKNMERVDFENRILQINRELNLLDNTKLNLARVFLHNVFPSLRGDTIKSEYFAKCFIMLIDKYHFRSAQIIEIFTDVFANNNLNFDSEPSQLVELLASRIIYCEVVNSMTKEEESLVNRIKAREILSHLNHTYTLSYENLILQLPDNKRTNRFKSLLKSIENAGAKIEIHYLSPDKFVQSKYYAQIASGRHRIFQDYNWKHQSPENIRNEFEADYRDLISNHIVITINQSPIAFARLCYPESTDITPDLEWFKRQGFLINGPISQGFSTESNGNDINNLSLYFQDSEAAKLINESAIKGTLFEAQRFLIDFGLLKQVYHQSEKLSGSVKEMYLITFISNILLSAFAGLSDHLNAEVGFDQADETFSKLLRNTLGDASEGGGFRNVGHSFTINEDGSRSKTLFNLILPLIGRSFASTDGNRSQAEALLAKLISDYLNVSDDITSDRLIFSKVMATEA